MWKYNIKNDHSNISLHDCRIEKVRIKDSDIIFEFDENGFWVLSNNKFNPYGKVLRTGKAEIRFTNCDFDFSRISMYKEFHLFRKPILTTRTKLSFKDFSRQINSGRLKFEVIDELYSFNQVLFDGCFWLNKKPYYRESQIQILFKDMLYSWNEINEDRTW